MDLDFCFRRRGEVVGRWFEEVRRETEVGRSRDERETAMDQRRRWIREDG